jgi:hypothetical protein
VVGVDSGSRLVLGRVERGEQSQEVQIQARVWVWAWLRVEVQVRLLV